MNWLGLAAVILIIDRRKPTLSSVFRESAHRYPASVTLATAYMVAHLYGAIPRRYDPLRRIA